MESQIQPTLTSDIQRALQHAVGEANSAFATSDDAQSTKKNKRKRPQQDEGVPADGKVQTVKEKKKKRTAQSDTPVATEASLPDATQQDAATKKKSKRSKGKQPVRVPPQGGLDFNAPSSYPQIEPQIASPSYPGLSQASTTAFLSALVAAASATNSESQPHPPYQQHHLLPGAPHPAHYMPYPPVHYGYHVPSVGYAHPSEHASVYPGGTGLPDFALGSSEDILRALQDLDVSKIASVLKTLGDAAAAANVPMFMPPPPPPDVQMQPPPTSSGQVPPSSQNALRQAIQASKPTEHKRTLDMSLPGPERHADPDHNHLLAHKWMNASKLAEMVKEEGLVYKKGKFSAIEEQQLKTAIEDYRRKQSLSELQFNELIYAKTPKGEENSFWSEMTSAVPGRPIIAVYHHIRRAYHPLKQQGKWMPTEDALLKEAVLEIGQQWEKVSERVGRMSSDCRDRYRNHIANRDIRITGHWTKEEEDELTRIVSEMTIQQGKDLDNDVFWGQVAQRMGNRRGRQQCRIKWTDSLSKTVKNEGQKPRWSQQDAYILVHKVDSMNVRDDTEIDWKTLSDTHWNLWSAHSLQRRWLTMKRSLKGFEDMTHQEIMDILRVKKAHFPTPPAPNRKRKVTSAAAIADSDNAATVDDTGITHQQAEAGSSTGPGTLAQAEVHRGSDGTGHSQDADGSTDSSE